MRAVLAVMTLAFVGCAELGVVTDGTSVSYGRPNRGYLIDGVKLPDKGDGFTTREMWAERGNRYGTDELVDLLRGVAKRMRKKVKDVRVVIADLSGDGGGASTLFHRSHQSGRDADILYYMRDADGKPFEADAMRIFDRRLAAKDGSGITVDVPRTWLLVKELLTADEATVQYVFMYQPIAEALIDHAKSIKEDPVLITRAMRACKQPGDSAPHNDHMHVRVYCATEDRQFGCVDQGAMELLAEREAEKRKTLQVIADALPRPEEPAPVITAAQVWAGGSTSTTIATTNGTLGSTGDLAVDTPAADPAPTSTPSTSTPSISTSTVSTTSTALPTASFSSLLRARADRIDLRGWR